MHDNVYCGTHFQDLRTDILFTHLSTMIRGYSNRLDHNTYNYMDDARSDGCLRDFGDDAGGRFYYNVFTIEPYADYSQRKGPVERAIEQPL